MKVNIFKSITAVVLTAVTITPIYSAINCDSKADNAVYCGKLPNRIEYTRVKKSQKKLVDCEWSIIEGGINKKYNCHSYAIGETNIWWAPIVYNDTTGKKVPHETIKLSDGTTIQKFSIDLNCGDGNGSASDIDFDGYYCDSNYCPVNYQITNDVQDAEIIVFGNDYEKSHSAKKNHCDCGQAAQWLMFRSKLGELDLIEHRHNQLSYGPILRMYKK